MKKSEAIDIIYRAIKNYDSALKILKQLEEAGFISPRYFVKSKDGMHHIVYGWEPE